MSTVDQEIPGYVRLAIAGLSGGGASMFTHPFDVIKYHMQLSGRGGRSRHFTTSFGALRHIIANEGPWALYNGLSAGILRQTTLSVTRMGLYSVIIDKLTSASGKHPSIFTQILAGLAAGGIGAIIGNPTDVVLVRMASDGVHHPEERRNYKNCFHALYRIVKEEGFKGLFIGWKPAALRSMVLNVTTVVLYKNTKVWLLNTGMFEDNVKLQVICSIWTAFVTSAATAPFDMIKTRLMASKHVDGKREYRGIVDVWAQAIKHEGYSSFWKGLTPMYVRLLPTSVLVFFFLEFLTKSYKRIVLGDTSGSGF